MRHVESIRTKFKILNSIVEAAEGDKKNLDILEELFMKAKFSDATKSNSTYEAFVLAINVIRKKKNG